MCSTTQCISVSVCMVSCAAEVTDGSQYFVLLMITDGVISDMVQTKESVVNVSTLPDTFLSRINNTTVFYFSHQVLIPTLGLKKKE